MLNRKRKFCSFISVRSDLFQHRLWLPTPPSADAPHEWTDLVIPFTDFTLTNSGDLSELQIEMLRTKVRTVGISVLGPLEGRLVYSLCTFILILCRYTMSMLKVFVLDRYELGIESIDAISLLEGVKERRSKNTVVEEEVASEKVAV